MPGLVLIFSRTLGYRHASIPAAILAMKGFGSSIGVQFQNTEDHTLFNDDNLKNYDAIVFLDTSGDVLDECGKRALQKYFDQGGNFVGIHSAADSMKDTPFFVRMIGASFDYHPDISHAVVEVIDHKHPSTRILPARWSVYDEMYNFESDPRDYGAVVVLSADEASYVDEGVRKGHGTPHPIAWYQEKGAGISPGGIAGRSFYTGLGHTEENWANDLFLEHVKGGISWVLETN